jgi:cytochrome c-type biogenesis protein CcmH/NrfF
MQGFVTDELKKGKEDEITASLVAKYGEVIAAPKAEGST